MGTKSCRLREEQKLRGGRLRKIYKGGRCINRLFDCLGDTEEFRARRLVAILETSILVHSPKIRIKTIALSVTTCPQYSYFSQGDAPGDTFFNSPSRGRLPAALACCWDTAM